MSECSLKTGREVTKIPRYIGIDIGKKKCRACVMDTDGFVLDEFNFENNRKCIDDIVTKLSTDDRVVMESTGNLWLNLYDTLERNAIQCTLANPIKTKAIASARIKSDKIDSKILAHLLRSNLVAQSYVPDKQTREMRSLVRHRASLVRTRAQMKNKVHAVIDKYGLHPAFSDIFGKTGTEWLAGLGLGPTDRLILDNYLKIIHGIGESISQVDDQITAIACKDENVKLLMSMTGIDVYTALLIRSEICDITRFENYKKLVAWAGLAPSLYQSSSTLYTGRITKQGSRMLRWIMVEAARVAVNHDEKMRVFYTRVASRRGDQKAIIAVANKMLKIIWVVLTRKEPYQSRNESLYNKKLNRLD